MMDEARTPTALKLEAITANQLKIARGSLNAGSISFQIRNIASLHITRHNDDEERKTSAFLRAYIPAVIMSLIAGFVLIKLDPPYALGYWVFISFATFKVSEALLMAKLREWFQLAILTNAASSYKLIIQVENVEDAWNFALQVKECIEAAMEAPDAATYSINIAEQKIEKVEANTTTVSHSPGANTIGGSATNVNQTSNVVVVAQGLQDISALIGIIETSNAQNAAMLKTHLETVRSTLAGGARSKDEARSAWSQFVEHAGSLTDAGNNVWELVARVGGLVAGWA